VNIDRLKHMACVIIMAVGIGGCAGSSITLVGGKHYDPLADTATVTVYSQPADAPQGFEVVAMIHYKNPGKYQSVTLDDAMPDLKSKARSVGADGIIIDRYEQIASGIVSRGIDVQARAIRLKK
jgi:hypothetical protein